MGNGASPSSGDQFVTGADIACGSEEALVLLTIAS